MRAAVSTRYGPPEVVRVVDDAPEPEVAPDDLLVRVHATTVNRTDCAYRRAYPFVIRAVSGWRAPKVARLGNRVRRGGRAGRRAGHPVRPRGPRLRLRRGSLRRPRRARRRGRVLVRRTGADGVDLHHAAAATEGGHYALSSIRRAGVEPGDRVLVHGATGAIGSAAVQLLADLGADVIATAPTRARRAGARARRPPRRRLRGRGLHRHRRDRRRRARPGRQEHLRRLPTPPRPATASTSRPTSGPSRRTWPCPWSPSSAVAAGSSSRSR